MCTASKDRDPSDSATEPERVAQVPRRATEPAHAATPPAPAGRVADARRADDSPPFASA
ncbi:hypothetical protein [Embleya scabrispora]|uniref:hypothetical protein n=1 Tax=Embleya scabrispora TaxID=159449 RepID=UPI001319D88A|nr:hypothetical protein [Embleya scabrispora]MYS83169.1 hypothetical protein [Streptomyces sp. SID5474]